MKTQSISFHNPGTRDNGGNRLAEGSDIPKMRANKRMTLTQLAERLGTALKNLASSPCSFWACDGPSRPKAMCTCRKCYAMRDVAAVKASLEVRP